MEDPVHDPRSTEVEPGTPVTPVEPVTRVAPVAPVTTVARVPVPAYIRVIRLIWFIAGLIDVLIGIRFLLKLFGASTASPFVSLINGLTAPLVAPFQNIFPVSAERTFVFEPASLVALVIYPLIALGIVSLIRILSQRRTTMA